jgi:TonB-dependent receptor
MRLKLLGLLFWVGSLNVVLAQNTGTITGKVIDENTANELINAVVKIQGTTLGAIADYNGVFTITNVPLGTYVIESSSLSYVTKTITDVMVNSKEPVNLVISLQRTSKTLNVVKITSTARKETSNGLLLMQKNSANVSDGVSAEFIKRTPDRNTSDVLKRVSGASIQDNKFAVIRGLNDRYNAALLNGAPLPSSEPDRKAFSFDIFPANLLDNLIITKTASPDMPAEFAGGIIQINTKDVPEKNFYALTVGSGYNTITTFNTRVYNKGGAKDWFGVDDGSRKIPDAIPSAEKFSVTLLNQAIYAEKTSFDWSIQKDKNFSPNLSFQYSMGYVRPIKKMTAAFVGAITYNKTNNYNETIRKTYTGRDSSISELQNDYLDKSYASQTLSGLLGNFTFKINPNNSISFKNLYSINSENKITNRTGTAAALDTPQRVINANNRFFISNQIYTGQINGEHYIPKQVKIKISWTASLSDIKRVIPSERRTLYSRYNAIVDTTYPNPLDTTWTAEVSSSIVGPDYSGAMFWSENHEQVKYGKINISRIFDISKDFTTEIKGGVFIQNRNRDFYARRLGYTKYGGSGSSIKFKDSLLYLPENEIFAPENMGRLEKVGNITKVGGFKLVDGTKPNDTYTAASYLNGYFFMIDSKYKFLRFVGGARYEHFQQILNAKKSVNEAEDVNLNIINNDLLPSLNLITAISKKQNIRLAYSQTVNRPEYRELAPFAFYDFTTKLVVSGYDSLRRAKINNLDIRYEFYPGRGQFISVSGFYKKFIDPVEQILSSYTDGEITYQNLPSAVNSGIEVEFRLLLASLFKADSIPVLNNLTVFSNLAVIRSEVNTGNKSGIGSALKPLQGQSPYVFNAGIQYLDIKNSFSTALSFNRVGTRIYIMGNENEPAIWEAPRSFMDFQIAKSFAKNKLEVKFNAQNILAQNQVFYQNKNLGNEPGVKGMTNSLNKLIVGDGQNKNGYNKSVDDLIWSTNFGAVYAVSIAYRF